MRRRGLAVLLGVLAALFAAELVLRLVAPDAEGLRGLHEVRPDRAWLYGLAPNVERRLASTGNVVYRTNADGFRDREYARPKPPGVFRIVVLGDSLAFGYGVKLEETFPKILESELARAYPGRRFEVLNLGVSGYNPYTEAALFADIGASYEPDLILVEFCINDLNDPTLHFDASTMTAIGELPDAAFPDPSTRKGPPSALRRWCSSSRLCERIARGLAKGSALDQAALQPHEHPNDGEIAWLENAYGGIAREAARLGAPLVVAIFPYEMQLAPDAATDVQQRLLALGERNRWAVIDLLPAFRSAAERGETPLFLDLWHPTEKGQRIAADALIAALRAKNLLDGAPAEGGGIELDRPEPRG